MSTSLRIILIALSLIACIYSIKKIRKSQMKIETSVIWFFFACCILIISIFPKIIYALGDLLGIQSPANLIYLIMIAICLYNTFSLSIKNSQLEYKLTILAEETAILRKQLEEKNIDLNGK